MEKVPLKILNAMWIVSFITEVGWWLCCCSMVSTLAPSPGLDQIILESPGSAQPYKNQDGDGGAYKKYSTNMI